MDVPSTGKNNLNLNVSKLKIEQKTIVSKLKSTLPQKAIRNPITKSVGYIGGSVGATVKFLAFTLPLTVAGTAIGVTGGAVGGGVGGAFTAAGGFLRGFLGFIAGVEEHMSGGAEMIGEGVALAVGTPFVGLAKGFMIGKNIGSSNALMNQEFKEVTKEIDKKQITKNIGDTELNAFFEKKIITDSEETNATGYIETNAEQLDRILTDPIHTTEKGEKIYIRPFSKNDEAQKAQKNQHFNAVKELKGIETKKDAIEYMKNNERGLFCLESKTFPIVESTDADLRIKLNSILRSNKSDADAMKELSDELDKYHGDIIEKIKNETLNDKSTEKNDNTTQEISYQTAQTKEDFKAALKKEVNSSSNIESYLMKIYEDTKKDDLLGQPKKEQEIKKRMDIKFNHFKQIESGGDFNTNLNSWIEENQKERDNYMKEIEEEYGKLAKKQKLIERFEEDYKRELDVKKYFEINDTLEKIEKGEIDRNGGFKYVKSLQSEIQDERLKELLVKRDDLNPIDQRLGEVRDFILEQFKIG